MLSVVFNYCYTEYCYAKGLYAECHYAECRGATYDRKFGGSIPSRNEEKKIQQKKFFCFRNIFSTRSNTFERLR
jgi:hypothetical protein